VARFRLRQYGLGLIAAAAGCAASRFAPPAGPAAAAPDAPAIWASASTACRAVHGYQAALKFSGRIDERRVPGLAAATINIAIADDLSLGLEGRAAGQLLFRLGGQPARATLLWREGNRVVTAPVADIMDALIGVRMDAARLRALLTGCVTMSDQMTGSGRYGGVIRITTPDADVFLRQQDGTWRPHAGTFDTWIVSYGDVRDALPRSVRIDSAPGHAPAASLSLTVTDLISNPSLPAAAFVVAVPGDATPMTLDELRSWRSK